jgi:hypothetical protein
MTVHPRQVKAQAQVKLRLTQIVLRSLPPPVFRKP